MHPVTRHYVSARCVHKNCAETKCNIAVFVTTMLQKYSGVPHNVSHLREFFECISTLRTGDAHLRFYITTVQDG